MYKITGYLNGTFYNEETREFVEIKETRYARFKWTLVLKTIYLKLFYDWVEIEKKT